MLGCGQSHIYSENAQFLSTLMRINMSSSDQKSLSVGSLIPRPMGLLLINFGYLLFLRFFKTISFSFLFSFSTVIFGFCEPFYLIYKLYQRARSSYNDYIYLHLTCYQHQKCKAVPNNSFRTRVYIDVKLQRIIYLRC